MQVVDINDSDLMDLYCPFCGTHTISVEEQGLPCPHLVFCSSCDVPIEPWYCRPGAKLDLDQDRTVPEILDAAFPGDEYVMFLLGGGAPSGMEVYVLFGSASSPRAP